MTPAQLRHRRKSLDLTQAELAEVLGVHRNTVVFWETGKKRIPPMLLFALNWLEYVKFRKAVGG